jgi:hypothetical protein
MQHWSMHEQADGRLVGRNSITLKSGEFGKREGH